MDRYVTGRELGRRICAALGIDPARVAGITLDCDAQDVARVTVEQYITEEQAEAILSAIDGYALDDEPSAVLDDLRFHRLVEEDAQ